MPDTIARTGWSRWRSIAALDFRRAVGRDTTGSLAVDADGRLTLAPMVRDGTLVSEPLDSGEAECKWHRIVIEADIPENSRIVISFSAGARGNPPRWSDGLVFTASREAMIPQGIKGRYLTGRYLTLKIELSHEVDALPPSLAYLKAYFPPDAFARFLPAAYRESDARESGESGFLGKMLSVFESCIVQVNETISRIPALFDPLSTPSSFVSWLSSWVSLDLYEHMEERNRNFIEKAWELYGKKGTVGGLASLVTFLTGKNCIIKEFSNNVFRAFGMEHCEADEYVDTEGRRRFYHKTSKTVDFSDSRLVNDFGTPFDRVHYTVDTRPDEAHNPRVIGIFITLNANEQLLVNEEQLSRIIKNFLPVFMRAKIVIVWESPEVCDLGAVKESCTDRLAAESRETIREIRGTYRDTPSWHLLSSYPGEPRGNSNDRQFRTPHSAMDMDHPT